MFSSITLNIYIPFTLATDALNTGSRKEKRQYKKRKHKVPRDKQQQQLHHQQQQHLQQQKQYLATIGVIPTSATTGAALGAGGVAGGVGGLGVPGGTATLPHHLPHHLHHHLHRQSSSPAPNESTIETEEEDLAHKIGSESEEEAPFAFRRKQGCDYLRVRSCFNGFLVTSRCIQWVNFNSCELQIVIYRSVIKLNNKSIDR